MRLLPYYSFCCIKNQILKLFKTWVFIFIIACGLIGGAVGYFGGTMAEKAEERQEMSAEAASDTAEEAEIGFLEANGIVRDDMIELIAGGVILVVFVFFILNADKNGARIFMPADVNLLFPSPEKPQSILIFRLMTQLGVLLFASIYLVFQIPVMTQELGLSLFAALTVVAVWGLTLIIGMLVEMLFYTLSSVHPVFRKHFRKGLYALLLLVAGGYLLTLKNSGEGYLKAAILYLNAPASRYIPVWGWLKGLLMSAVEGSMTLFICFCAAILILSAVLVYVIWHAKIDFYEEALAKSEETAALLEKLETEKGGGIRVARSNKKDRSERLRRDGMRHGSGANVFFFKSMYNRFRFARFGFLTKTMGFYIFAAAVTALICRFGPGTRSVIPLVLVLSGLTYFRTIGNPLEQDTQMDFFSLIPEKTSKKLFWSLMGGTVNCLLDLIPAVLIGTLILQGSLTEALVWLPFIISVDLFATCVGCFIGLSVPGSAGKTIKEMVQMMFIYFGLLPDVVFIVIGFVYEHLPLFVLITTLFNFAIGFLFFVLAAEFIEPREGKRRTESTHVVDTKKAKKVFSALGLAIFTLFMISSAAQIGLMMLMDQAVPGWSGQSWLNMLITFAPIYLIGVPCSLLVLRKIPKAAAAETRKLGVGGFFTVFAIMIFMMYSGNLIGIAITSAITSLMDVSPVNPVIGLAMDTDLLPKILFTVILAPLIEELVFRKMLIDRMSPYGERLAVITSAVMFGLFHGNLSQMFYAFGIGLVFGYVYLKTGRLRYSVLLHMLVNFIGSVVSSEMLKLLDMNSVDALAMSDSELFAAASGPAFSVFLVYIVCILTLCIGGLLLLIVKGRRIRFSEARDELPKGMRFRTVWLNIGMILFLAACLFMILASVFA